MVYKTTIICYNLKHEYRSLQQQRKTGKNKNAARLGPDYIPTSTGRGPTTDRLGEPPSGRDRQKIWEESNQARLYIFNALEKEGAK